MGKLFRKTFLIISLVSMSFVSINKAHAEIDPKMKALGLMAGYGAVGGALLGTASLAFGTDGRSVAKGASLGLYAGIIFGSYVVLSYAYKKNKEENPQGGGDYYPDTSKSPYEEESNGGGGSSWFDFGGNGDQEGSVPPAQRLNILKEQELQSLRASYKAPMYKNKILFYLPLINYQF